MIASLAGQKAAEVEAPGHPGDLKLMQDADGLKAAMPPERPCQCAFSLKITELEL